MAKKIKYVGAKAINVGTEVTFSDFNNSFSTTIFNGDINISTNLFSNNDNIIKRNNIITTSKNISLIDLNIKSIDQLDEILKINNKLKLNYNKSELSNYANYGSLVEKFRFSINNIINTFLGGLYINYYKNYQLYYTVNDYVYDPNKNESSFKIPINLIENPFGININTNNEVDTNHISNFVTRFNDYVLNFNDINYGIYELTAITNSNKNYMYLVVDGNPFEGYTGSSISVNFLIKPNDIEYNKFYNNLTDLEQFLLNKNSNPKYTATFNIPNVDEDDNLNFITTYITFPTLYDGYNIDVESISYNNYVDNLFNIGSLYDEYKSNLILRKLILKNVIELDKTSELKSEKLLKIYGKEIDEIKVFMDSLLTFNNISYDKIDNIPDTLIKNLAKTLSWNSTNIINDKKLIESVFTNDKTNDTDINATLFEVDTELWRRLVINTSYFLKNKGTRSAIETLFSFIGAPDCLIEFNEYVYVVDGKIDPKNVPIEYISRPYDENGYPIAYQETSDLYFQHAGNNDSGQAYIDIYRNVGFNVVKTIDNKKSWVYYQSASTHNDFNLDTDYDVDDSRLIINTKEVNIAFDLAKAIECDVYSFNFENYYPVSLTGRPIPYPAVNSAKIDVQELTFSNYIKTIYSNFINVKNRKVSDSALNSSYPSLTKLYYDYLNESVNDIGILSNRRRYRNILDYVNNIDKVWDQFIKGFIPATTILSSNSIKIRNTVFTPQKFPYKHGIDDGSEFRIEQPSSLESENVALITLDTEFFDTIETENAIASIEGSYISSDSSVVTNNFVFLKQNTNLQPKFNSNNFTINKPDILVTGATKLSLSTLTNNSLYIFNENSGHVLNFEFTGVTSSLTGNNFIYKIYEYDDILSGFSTSVFTSITNNLSSTSVNDIVENQYLKSDYEYIIKPYFEFNIPIPSGTTVSNTEPYTNYDLFSVSGYPSEYSNALRFFDRTKYSGATGSTVNTFLDTNQYEPEFIAYNKDSDFYFVSVSTPDTPNLLLSSEVNTDLLYVENITVDKLSFTSFSITYVPVGDVIISVNGVTLTKGIEYDNDNTIIVPSFKSRSFVLNQTVTLTHKDVINVAYKRSEQSTNPLKREDFVFTTNSENIIFNTATTKYEIHLSYNILEGSDIIVFYNGLFLSKTLDYNVSVYNNIISVLNFTGMSNGDVFTVIYEREGIYNLYDLIIPKSNPYTISWSIDSVIQPNVDGYFIHEFYDLNNTGLTGNSVYSSITMYNYISSSYEQNFNWSETSLIFGQTYYYRIRSEKYYTTINNIEINLSKSSNIYRIQIPD